jgi:hypothetical protein
MHPFNHPEVIAVKFPCAPLLISLSLSMISVTHPALAAGRMVDLVVVDRDSGQSLPTYYYRGQNYIVGTPGNRYAVRVRNMRRERVLTVVSVDGVNVVSGETAAPNQTGYVLDTYEVTEINGWRKDLDQVAAFVFANESDSYAARTGRPGNVGVIGVAVFREKERPIRWRDGRIAPEAGAPAESASRADGGRTPSRSPELSKRLGDAGGGTVAEAPRLGTGHGERESSHVDYTDFTRARNTPDEVISIRYDSYRNLVALGVIPARRPERQPAPNPFPGQFVPDPR